MQRFYDSIDHYSRQRFNVENEKEEKHIKLETP